MGEESSISGSVLPPGTILNEKYDIIAPLGSGGMGRVYLAEDRSLRRKVAVKMLRDRARSHERVKSIEGRFDAESMLPAGFAHPNVITVFERGVYEGRDYFVMEYMPEAVSLGDMLRDRVERGKSVSEECVRDLLMQGLKALRAAHSVGVWHRDVKLDNFLVFVLTGGELLLKLIDFGVAHDPNFERTLNGEYLGTVSYWAPEILLNPKEVNHRIDLYALGVTFYRFLTGVRPFPKIVNLQSAISHHHLPSCERPRVTPPTELRTDILKGWDYSIFRLMEPEVADRYQSADEAMQDLAQLEDLPEYTGTLGRDPQALMRVEPTKVGYIDGPLRPGNTAEKAKATSEPAAAEVSIPSLPASAIEEVSESALGLPSWAVDLPVDSEALSLLGEGSESLDTAGEASSASAAEKADKVDSAAAMTPHASTSQRAVVEVESIKKDPAVGAEKGGEVSQGTDGTIAGFARHLEAGGGLGTAGLDRVDGRQTDGCDSGDLLPNIQEIEQRKATRKKVLLTAGFLTVWVTVIVVLLEPWSLLGGNDASLNEDAAKETDATGFPVIKYKDESKGTVTKEDVAQLLRRNPPEAKTNEPWELGEAPGVAASTNDTAATPTEAATHQAVPTTPTATTTEPTRPRPKAVTAQEVPKPGRPENVTLASREQDMPATPEPPEPPERSLDSELGRFFAVGRTVGREKDDKNDKAPGLQLGQRIRVRINVGISSKKHGKVLATPIKPVVVGRRIVVPKNAVLVGRSSSGDRRIYIDFSEMVVGKKHLRISGHAISGDLAGLQAQIIKTSLPERQKQRAGNSAMGTAAGVAADVVGVVSGTAGEVVRRVGGDTVDEAINDNKIDRSEHLVVPAKTEFEILITE